MAKSWDTIVEEVAQQIYDSKLKGSISPAMVKKQAAKLMDGVKLGFADAGTVTAQDKKQIEALQKNVYVFSGFKNHAQLKECIALLLDDKGNIRPFADFLKDVKAIDKTYNVHYLEAEYQHAQAASTMISKWNDITEQADTLPFLRYEAIMDDRVRPEHKVLNGKVKRWDDDFWKTYYPPNGWNCRCEVRQLANATEDDIAKFPKVPPMFRNNVGIDGIIFPDTHPYFNDVSKAEAKSIVSICMMLIPIVEKTEAEIIAEALESGKFTKIKGYNIEVSKLHGKKEAKSNIRTAKIFEKQGEKIKLLPIFNEKGQHYVDAFHENANQLWEYEHPETSNGKNAIQNSIKEISRQKAKRGAIHLIENYKADDLIVGFLAAFQKGRAKTIEEIILIYKDNTTLRISRKQIDNRDFVEMIYKHERQP